MLAVQRFALFLALALFLVPRMQSAVNAGDDTLFLCWALIALNAFPVAFASTGAVFFNERSMHTTFHMATCFALRIGEPRRITQASALLVVPYTMTIT